MPPGYPEGGVRRSLADFICAKHVQWTITALILLNALTLGLETSESVMAEWGSLLLTIDSIIITVFAIEVGIRIVAFGPSFFRGGWNWFDFLIVGVSLLPSAGEISVLRSLRILRVLRLVSIVPQMRTVVTALLQVIPGMGTVALLLLLIFYVGAVMATKLFGQTFPEWFGTIGASMYSLFQIMTLESWSMGIVRPVMEEFPAAWVFFVPFILITTFAVLNLFVAIVVDAMQSAHKVEAEAVEAEAHAERIAIGQEIRALRGEIAELRVEIAAAKADSPDRRS
ncbi:MAG TPA: ion transporter [Alphaproteobacteria bacterium]|nr:ion transporter [Alphaproteobacteria bacterium]